jgi:hypothetical protein
MGQFARSELLVLNEHCAASKQLLDDQPLRMMLAYVALRSISRAHRQDAGAQRSERSEKL